MVARSRRAAVTAAVFAALSIMALRHDVLAQGVRQLLPAAPAKPYVVEYSYKVKWGHFAEFIDLYTKNHYPLLQRFQKMGRIVSMSAAYPINHAGETSRWDLRFTIVWKDATTAFEDFDQSAIVKELFPDQETFKKEEQRRFELLIEHMDVPVRLDDLKKW